MRSLFLALLLCSAVPVLADTYTGVVSDVKHFQNGGVAVDLDGHWPDQKMTFYVPPADAQAVGALPADGDKVTASGTQGTYRGKPEIKIHQASQWKW